MGPLKVLIVDDSVLMRTLVRRGLRQAGIEVTAVLEASNGIEALTKLAGESVDLILCDWNMPEMDGPTFVREVRKTMITPIVIITTEASEAKIRQATQAGVSGYIRKPFTAESLRVAITASFGAPS